MKNNNAEFSIPIQYDNIIINAIIEYNNSLPSNRKITSVFGSLMRDSKEAVGWENYRDRTVISSGRVLSIQSISDMMGAINKFKKAGIIFQYCLNSTRTLTAEMLFSIRPKIFNLCDSLLENEISHLKISNLLLFDFIYEYYGDKFKYYLSTTKEYSSIDQFRKLLKKYPSIREICMPSDLNKNIRFLKNFKNAFPDIDIEIMVNEGCMYACPWRTEHTPHSSGTNTSQITRLVKDGKCDIPLEMVYYYGNRCYECRSEDYVTEYFKRRSIMPFDILYYVNKLGISKYKFAGRDVNQKYLISSIMRYINGIDDFSSIARLPWNYFNNYSEQEIYYINSPTIEQMRNYFPPISHFDKYGHLCNTDCGETCNACYNYANTAKQELHIKDNGIYDKEDL